MAQYEEPSVSALPARQNINWFVVIIAMIAAVAGILFGFDTGIISGAILFIRSEFSLTHFQQELVIFSVLLGAFIGSGVSGRFSDYFGRRNLLIITSVIFLVGTIGSAVAENTVELFVTRMIVGFAIGIASYVAPLYLSEVSPPKYRGALVSLNQLAITIGILVAYFVDNHFAGQGDWRWMFGVGVIPAFILFVGMLFLPESPRWLLFKGRIESARKTLKKIRDPNVVEVEMQEIARSIQSKSDWRLLLQKWLIPAIVIGLGLAFFQQFTGINTIIYYAPTVFQLAGFSTATQAISATMVVGVVNVLFTIIALPLIDFWGRRPLLLVGLTGMALSLGLLSLAFHLGAHSDALRWMALGCILTFIACFAISLGPIMWLIISEVFPLEIRGLGSSLAVSASWAFNGIVALTFLTLIDLLGESGTFLIYAILCVLGWIFVYMIVPETRGVTLEQIEKNLRKGVKPRDLGEDIG